VIEDDWQGASARSPAGYLQFLSSPGYTLSEVEQLVMKRTARLATEAEDETDADDDDGADEAEDIDSDCDED
jgi:hypothetical protein